MQDLSRYRKKDHIEIQTRYVSLLLAGSVALVGLVFALGVLVGSRGRSPADACAPPDPLAALDAQSGEPAPPAAVEMRTFHDRLTEPGSPVPTPASLLSEGPSGPAAGGIATFEDEPMAPRHEEDPLLEKVTEAEPGVYSLQVASFDSQAEASEMVRRLRRAGHESFLVSVTGPDDVRWYRVRVGPFDSKTTAWRYKAAFEEKERLPAFVVKRRRQG